MRVRDLILPFLGAGALLACSAADAQTPAPTPGSTAVNIMQATAAIQANDCKTALPILAQLWDDASLNASDPDLAGQFRLRRILCTAQTAGPEAALVISADNLKREPVSVDGWGLHVFLQAGSGKGDEAAQTLDMALDRLGPKASEISDLSVIGTLWLLHEKNVAREAALLGHLEDAGWQVHDVTSRPLIDELRLEALRLAVASGDQAHAAAFRADIARDSSIYIISQGDGALSAAATAPLDVRPILADEIAGVKAYLLKNPTDLSAISYLISLEITAGQAELALTQANSIIGLVDSNALTDFENPDGYSSILSQKANILADLGKTDEADKAYLDGEARLQGRGTLDFYIGEVNYLINRGRQNDAVTLIGRFDLSNLRPDQKGQVAALIACAAAYAGDTKDYASIVAAMPAGLDIRTRPMLCAGDSQGAAANIIAEIGDPSGRDEAILLMQDRPAGIAWSARNQLYIDALTALRKRSDVLAAGTRANIIVRSWPIRF
ncbi:MAG: hypothetical protein ACXU8U_10260 [Asticcacaulis sp.]